jgi:hypothetical protein
MDLVWPPLDEDLDACTVVNLDGGNRPEQAPRVEPAPGVEAAPRAEAAPVIAAPQPRPRFKPTFGDCRDPGVAPRIRPLVFPMEPPPLPVSLAGEDDEKDEQPDELDATEAPPDEYGSPDEEPMVFFPLLAAESNARSVADPEVAGASRSAWLAVFFAAACALVTIGQYRAMFSLPAEAGPSAAEQPPVPEGVSATELAPGIPRAVPPAVRKSQAATRQPAAPAQKPAKLDRKADVPPRQALVVPVRPSPAPIPKVTPIVPAPAPAAERSRLAAASPGRTVQGPEPTVPRVAVAVLDRGIVATPATIASPPPASAPVASTAAPAEPTANSGTAGSPRRVAAVLTEAVIDDETNIRSTLTRFRTAYSQLDAGAARAVWPSVDTRALARAFQSLKSQDLRFDQCSLTVTGVRAQAACKGRAIYVPRIGDQSPRYTAREWTFELRKADERWTIASARTL